MVMLVARGRQVTPTLGNMLASTKDREAPVSTSARVGNLPRINNTSRLRPTAASLMGVVGEEGLAEKGGSC